MATIPTPGSELRHVRKTVTFTGGAGAGAVGNVTVFPITGRVFAKGLTAFCTTSLTDAGGVTPATITLGVPSKPTWFSTALDPADGLLADQWWDWGFWGPTPAGQAGVNLNLGQSNGTFLSISEDVIITIANEAVTGGVIVFDIWYTPVTDDGALAGDDIDEDLKTNIWSKALSDISSVPAITASAKDALNWLFALARNKRTQTATTETVYKDDGSTSLATSTKSDDGTTYTRGEYS